MLLARTVSTGFLLQHRGSGMLPCPAHPSLTLDLPRPLLRPSKDRGTADVGDLPRDHAPRGKGVGRPRGLPFCQIRPLIPATPLLRPAQARGFSSLSGTAGKMPRPLVSAPLLCNSCPLLSSVPYAKQHKPLNSWEWGPCSTSVSITRLLPALRAASYGGLRPHPSPPPPHPHLPGATRPLAITNPVDRPL